MNNKKRALFTEDTWTEGGDFQKYAINRLLSDESDMTNSDYTMKLDYKKDDSPTIVNPSWFTILISALKYTER